MTDSMIERVFGAISAVLDGFLVFGHAGNQPSAVYRCTADWQPIGEPVFTGGDVECQNYIRRLVARAAIEAMRTPTEAMVFCGAATYDHPSVYMGGPSHSGRRNSSRIWPAMIDAALKEKP